MASQEEQQLLFLSNLLQLEKRLRQAQNLRALAFTAANEPLRLVSYSHALVWHYRGRKLAPLAASGVNKPDPAAPLVHQLGEELARRFPAASVRTPTAFSRQSPEGKEEYLLWVPLFSPGGEAVGGISLSRRTEWKEEEKAFFSRLGETLGHAWWALAGRERFWKRREGRKKSPLFYAALGIGLLLLSLFPLRMNVLAPARIVPKNPVLVSPALDGVVKEIYVEPNGEVQAGEVLVSLDDTSLTSRKAVILKELAVVEREHANTQQNSFSDPEARQTLTLLAAELDKKKAEAEYVATMLEQTRIVAEKEGIAVFRDKSDWLGKPVVIGEKIMLLADPQQVEIEIQLPAGDAIALAPDAELLFFLDSSPQAPLAARLHSIGYDAQLTPEGYLAYRLMAEIESERIPRIGLRGTARIYGQRAPLLLYLLRKPLTFLRQHLGF